LPGAGFDGRAAWSTRSHGWLSTHAPSPGQNHASFAIWDMGDHIRILVPIDNMTWDVGEGGVP
jgi:hypothetical protein